MAQLRRVPITDPCVSLEVRRYCVERSIPTVDAWFDGKDWIGLWPVGAFGENMSELARKYGWKTKNAANILMEVGFQLSGALPAELDRELHELVARVNMLGEKILQVD